MSLSFTFSPQLNSPQIHTIETKLKSFKAIIENPKTQFFYTFNRAELLHSTQSIYEKYKNRKMFVHVGIGGSSLGPEMLVNALKTNDQKFIFINNIDPEEIYSQLQEISQFAPSECLFYFVSKSGGTAETMAALSIITQYLSQKGISKSDLKNYFVFATDKHKSELLDLARELHVDCLEVPSDVGGRFCALTPVGFLPAYFAGIDVKELIKGATDLQSDLLNSSIKNNLVNVCDFLFHHKNENNVHQTVMMPYSSKLKSFSFWFTQLWAESLGKKLNLKNEVVNVGFTPIVAYGATDQHSQMQLFMEGPNDKCLVFIEVVEVARDFSLKSELLSNNLNKLSGFKLSELMKAELDGTLKALEENKRPFIHLKIAKNDAYHMGQLILFFESLTALMGHYLMIDPFDQPGVEAGKIYAFEYLNKLK